MADENEDKSSKTEEPSERKIQKAREKGQVARSKEVNNFFAILAILIAVFLTLPYALTTLMNLMGAILSEAGTLRITGANVLGFTSGLFIQSLIALLPTLMLLLMLSWFGSIVQNGFMFTFEPIMPKLEKISVIKGFGRLFALKALVEFLKSMIKMIVIGGVLVLVIMQHTDGFALATDMSLAGILLFAQELMIKMLIGVLIVMAIMAVLDFLYQKFEFRKDNMMSRKEMKDEYKESEGDPYIKNRQKQLRMERARSQMMSEVPKAQVVVTNPTHYAVALAYNQGVDAAPKVLAMGVDHMAMKIREIAKENDIPFVEDPALARALYAQANVGEEIPLELFEAVAQVISFLMALKRGVKPQYTSALSKQD